MIGPTFPSRKSISDWPFKLSSQLNFHVNYFAKNKKKEAPNVPLTKLTDGAFHFIRDESVQLDGIFHR